MKSINPRFSELLDLVVDGTCSDSERQEFSNLVELDHDLAPEVVEQLRTHSLLQWQTDQLRVFVAPNDLEIKPPDAQPEFSQRQQSRRLRGTLWMAAAAVALFCGIVAWQHVGEPGLPPSGEVAVAEIVRADLVNWSDRTTALKDGRCILPGRLEMTSGTLTLRFRSGATVTAQGPATMEIESDMLVRLEKGQATAHVPQWARGFTIETPDVEVVDLGTQFGVVAREGGTTDVVVFEGEVDLKRSSEANPFNRRLTQGEGARISNRGAIDRIVEVRRDRRGERWSTDKLACGHSTIKSLRDNIRPSDSAKYYQVTAGGLVDDVQAYVDRPHQWNGLTSEGLPDFLRGADFVRTFNEYKYLTELEITVELGRPANLYIFFDDRVSAPKWLTDQFEDTGVNIGLDEGAWPLVSPNDPNLSVAVGAGDSVDNVFSVWRRRCEAADIITLGPMGAENPPTWDARAIYGIAASPLD